MRLIMRQALCIRMDSTRHVLGWHLTQETRVHNVFDDAAGTIHQALPSGQGSHAGSRPGAPRNCPAGQAWHWNTPVSLK